MEKRTVQYPTQRKASSTKESTFQPLTKAEQIPSRRILIGTPVSKTSNGLSTKTRTTKTSLSTPMKTKSKKNDTPNIKSSIPMKRYGQFQQKEYLPLRALGVDQGYANCGYSVVEWSPHHKEPIILTMGVIETKANLPMGERLATIEEKLTTLALDYEVKAIGCEKLFVNPPQKKAGTEQSSFAERNKSASIVTTSMVSGLIHLIAHKLELWVQDYTPGTVKKQVTGYGRASKDRVYEMVYALIPSDFLTNKKARVQEGETHSLRKPKDHETDAVAIGITTIREYFNYLENEWKTQQTIK